MGAMQALLCFVMLGLALGAEQAAEAGGELVTISMPDTSPEALNAARIQPWPENPRYWQYQGAPVLLLGGSWQDNLFNHPHGLEAHLDGLVAAGGNYLRNVMGHRNDDNVFAYVEVEDRLFDLDQWNPEYWRRFEHFLQETYARDIIVQIEVWATYDFHGDYTLDEATDYVPKGGWEFHPFNPLNNINYTAEESGVRERNDFYFSPPDLHDNAFIRDYQHRFVDRILEYTLRYPHVLYCMNNETNKPVEWGDYWVDYIQRKGREAGVGVETTDMRFDVDLRTSDNAHIFERPESYTFIEASQNNHQAGDTHWQVLRHAWTSIADHPRPINNTKVYSTHAGDTEAVARFVRNILGGAASTRFHRPHPEEGPDVHYVSSFWGLGLSPMAQATIQTMRRFTLAFDVFRAVPYLEALSDRDDNTAYCMAIPDAAYAVYFPKEGQVTLDLGATLSPVTLRWMEVATSAWRNPVSLEHNGSLDLSPPDDSGWIALVSNTGIPPLLPVGE